MWEILFPDVPVLIITIAGMVIGGDQFIRGSAAIGRRMGMTPILIGATIVAIGTSLPEWAVTVDASLRGMPDLSAGNIFGSNVFNICIILGITALIRPFRIGISWLPRDGLVMLWATMALLVVCVDGTVSRVEGLCLLALAIATLVSMVVSGRGEKEKGRPFSFWDIPRTALGLPLILVSSHFFIGAAASLAGNIGISEWIVGITVAAMGTSLPELVTAIAAVVQRRPGLVVGNLLGSNTMNIFFALGSAASVHPIISGHLGVVSALVFTGVMILSVALLAAFRGLTRIPAVVVLLAGIGWYVIEWTSG